MSDTIVFYRIGQSLDYGRLTDEIAECLWPVLEVEWLIIVQDAAPMGTAVSLSKPPS